MKRSIKFIVVHCTATLAGADFKVKDIDMWHKQRGFAMIGYHYVVNIDGSVDLGRPETQAGAHVKGHNHDSIGVVYVGGLDTTKEGKIVPTDTRTKAQKEALVKLLTSLKKKYPDAIILGHRDFPGVKKACPCFNAKEEYNGIS